MANRGGYVPTPRAAVAAATVAGNLRRIRLGMGWSLDGAARHLGVKVATLGAHERGSRAMTVDQVHRYAAGYAVATEALFAGTPQQQVPSRCEIDRVYRSDRRSERCNRTPVVAMGVGVCAGGHEVCKGACQECVDLASLHPVMPCGRCGEPNLVTFIPVTS